MTVFASCSNQSSGSRTMCMGSASSRASFASVILSVIDTMILVSIFVICGLLVSVQLRVLVLALLSVCLPGLVLIFILLPSVRSDQPFLPVA